jgi:hypothetical protein
VRACVWSLRLELGEPIFLGRVDNVLIVLFLFYVWNLCLGMDGFDMVIWRL